MRRFADLAEARAAWEASGGYLLELAPGLYGVTDTAHILYRLRGAEWMRRCDRLECWDETALRLAAAA